MESLPSAALIRQDRELCQDDLLVVGCNDDARDKLLLRVQASGKTVDTTDSVVDSGVVSGVDPASVIEAGVVSSVVTGEGVNGEISPEVDGRMKYGVDNAPGDFVSFLLSHSGRLELSLLSSNRGSGSLIVGTSRAS